MHVKIRKAVPEDAALLAELGATTFYDTFSAFHSEEDMQLYLKKAYAQKDIAVNLTNPEIAYFIAFDGDTAAGYTKLLRNASHPQIQSTAIELEKIYVRKNYLGKNVGKALMDHALNYARTENFEILFLGVWQENNRAVNFYKKAGMEVFTTRTFQLGQTLCDDYLLKIDLQEGS
ncbi:MAG: GNAT family N-acetyltransferase [Bacteroidia bacterium]|jgi:ribosomal protein S18 acetylase RimI-like enzyme